MNHRGLRERPTGPGRTSCGAAIPGDRLAALAERGDPVNRPGGPR